MLKHYGLFCVMALTVALTFGCAKKAPVVEPVAEPVVEQNVNNQYEKDIQAITDCVVYFDFDKFDIKESFRPLLAERAEILKKYSKVRVIIEGNCDARGTQEYNLALGERRALAVYEYMVMLGVDPSQMEVISYGKERPAVQGNTVEAWTWNRRDNFRILSR